MLNRTVSDSISVYGTSHEMVLLIHSNFNEITMSHIKTQGDLHVTFDEIKKKLIYIYATKN